MPRCGDRYASLARRRTRGFNEAHAPALDHGAPFTILAALFHALALRELVDHIDIAPSASQPVVEVSGRLAMLTNAALFPHGVRGHWW